MTYGNGATLPDSTVADNDNSAPDPTTRRERLTSLIVELRSLCDDTGKRVYKMREVAEIVSEEYGEHISQDTVDYYWREYQKEQLGETVEHRNTSRMRPLPSPGTIIRCPCGHTRPVEEMPKKCPKCRTSLITSGGMTHDVIVVE